MCSFVRQTHNNNEERRTSFMMKWLTWHKGFEICYLFFFFLQSMKIQQGWIFKIQENRNLKLVFSFYTIFMKEKLLPVADFNHDEITDLAQRLWNFLSFFSMNYKNATGLDFQSPSSNFKLVFSFHTIILKERLLPV